MKKAISMILTVMIICTALPIFSGLTASAEDVTSENFSYIVTNGKATVTSGYVPEETNTIVIPDTLDGYPVTAIGDYAFYSRSNLKSIIIPDGITKLGCGVFEWCENLESIYLSKNLESIPYHTFRGCCKLNNVVITGKVSSIGVAAFQQCSALTNVTITSELKRIEGEAFIDCNSLQEVILPDSVETICLSAFWQIQSLESINMPKNLKTVEDEAFYGCVNIKELVLPNGLETIGVRAFAGIGIKHLTIPGTVISIGFRSFMNCPNLSQVVFMPGITMCDSSEFEYCTSLKSITVPDTITYLDQFTFSSVSCTLYVIKDSYVDNTIKEYKKVGYYNNITLDYVNQITQLAPVPEDGFVPDVVTYGTGVTITDRTATYENGALNVSKDGYYPVSVSNCTLTKKGRKKLALVPFQTESYISAVHSEGVDLLASSITVYDTDTTKAIYVYSASLYGIKKVQLLHKTTVVAESEQDILYIEPSKLQDGSDYYIRIVKSDGTVCPKLKIGLTISRAIDIDVSLGDLCSFTIPSDVPIIGGKELELSLSNLPVGINYESGCVQVVFGNSFDFVKKEFGFESFKKYFNDVGKDIKEAKKFLK